MLVGKIMADKALVMDIQRYSLHDGPGIRTTVFLKGCHMKCKWCHNPESQSSVPQLLFYENKCIQCGTCKKICSNHAHQFSEDGHHLFLKQCMDCEKKETCALICPTQAIQLCGRIMDVDEVMRIVRKDRILYGEEGGVTCSGGEALMQADFVAKLFKDCKKENISTCLDTTLNMPFPVIEKILDWTDSFLVDVKFMSEENHKSYTGCSGEWTLKNLRTLSGLQKRIILRMPMVMGLNDTEEEIQKRILLLKELKGVERIDIFPVTNHASSKYQALQMPMERFHDGIDMDSWIDNLQKVIGSNFSAG